jgi:hypothetical protein
LGPRDGRLRLAGEGDSSPEVALVTGDAFLEALHGFALRSLENAAVAGKLAWIVRDEGGLVLGSRYDEIEDRLVEIEDVRDYRKEP